MYFADSDLLFSVAEKAEVSGGLSMNVDVSVQVNNALALKLDRTLSEHVNGCTAF